MSFLDRQHTPVSPDALRQRATEFHCLADATLDPVVHDELRRLAEACLRHADELERDAGPVVLS
jgi:hypothetical protein